MHLKGQQGAWADSLINPMIILKIRSSHDHIEDQTVANNLVRSCFKLDFTMIEFAMIVP